MVMKPEMYSTISSTPYVAPENPDNAPNYPAGKIIQWTRDQYLEEFNTDKEEFVNHTNMHAALKSLIIESVDAIYVSAVRNKYTAYLSVSVRQIIDHLLNRYGKITARDLHSNTLHLQEPIETSLPLDHYFKRIEDCVEYAIDGKDPIPAKTVLNTAYHGLNITGMYKITFKDWKKIPDAEKTFKKIQKTFLAEYSDIREGEKEQGCNNYHLSNYVGGE